MIFFLLLIQPNFKNFIEIELQMNQIIAKKKFSEDVTKFEIRSPIALNEINAGQYILLTVAENEPGIAVAVLKTNPEKVSVTVLVYANNYYSGRLAELNAGSELFAIDGPFGYPVPVENFGTVLCVSRGPGAVLLLPVLNSLHAAGNRIITILSAQTNEGIILEEQIKAVSDELITVTDDGSYGEKRSVCQAITQAIQTSKINQVVAVGSATTIKVACAHTTKYNIPVQSILYLTKAGKNNGHGIFNISSCGTSKSVCVDGYNFNAWYSGFGEMIKRFGDEEEIPCKIDLAREVNSFV